MTSLPPGVPPFVSFVPPPLPPGWTEHQAPGGQTYYYHAAAGQSTYTRPLPAMPGGMPFMAQGAVIPGSAPPKEKKKKERPLLKTPVPGTSWLRVKTTEGNVFWTHKERKESLWVIPEEIKEQAEAMEREERGKEEEEAIEKEEQERMAKEEEEEQRKQREKEEVERVMEEVKDAVAAGKRKATEPIEEDKTNGHKKARVEDAIDGDDVDEEWQRKMADEMAAEVEEGREEESVDDPHVINEEDNLQASPTPSAKESDKLSFKVPNRVDLSVDEAKALFKTLLQEKQINPLHPWDTSLPLFISDPRYVLLPSVSARREAFDEYCRDAARAQRFAKAAALKEESAMAAGEGKENKEKDAYDRLLKEEVTSTRMTWHEFRRKWKKDRRYFGWAGERERERAFRDWVKDLGETKKKAAEKAEREFFQLLREHREIKPGDVWKEAKRKIDPKDSRYEAVGSSSLREELFGTYVKTLSARDKPDLSSDKAAAEQDEDAMRMDEEASDARRKQRKDRAERGLREREEKVRREREGLERELGRTRGAVGREEGEREFMSLLTDAVRDPQARWDSTSPSLAKDPRYVLSALPLAAQRALFEAHVARLQEKHLTGLHVLFAAHAPSLSLAWPDLPRSSRDSIRGSMPANRLGLSGADDEDGEEADRDLSVAFERWQRTRTADARKVFDDMLGENAFLEFWGRMGKAGGEGLDSGVPDEGEEEEEGEGGGGRADLKKLARSVDVSEVGKVLKSDARWTAFDHVPEQRERWLRAHMERLAAPKLSVHVPDKV